MLIVLATTALILADQPRCESLVWQPGNATTMALKCHGSPVDPFLVELRKRLSMKRKVLK